MKTLFIGGIKSGKSKSAEENILKTTKTKPIYLATNEFFDEEMKRRVALHKEQREEKFISIEEPLHLTNIIKNANTSVLVECVSMWINNMLYHKYDESAIEQQIKDILELHQDVVFVINDVSCSVVSDNKLVREFVDINGRIAQLLALKCDCVYNTVAGISVKIK